MVKPAQPCNHKVWPLEYRAWSVECWVPIALCITLISGSRIEEHVGLSGRHLNIDPPSPPERQPGPG
jgi:hypothetical protein